MCSGQHAQHCTLAKTAVQLLQAPRAQQLRPYTSHQQLRPAGAISAATVDVRPPAGAPRGAQAACAARRLPARRCTSPRRLHAARPRAAPAATPRRRGRRAAAAAALRRLLPDMGMRHCRWAELRCRRCSTRKVHLPAGGCTRKQRLMHAGCVSRASSRDADAHLQAITWGSTTGGSRARINPAQREANALATCRCW